MLWIEYKVKILTWFLTLDVPKTGQSTILLQTPFLKSVQGFKNELLKRNKLVQTKKSESSITISTNHNLWNILFVVVLMKLCLPIFRTWFDFLNVFYYSMLHYTRQLKRDVLSFSCDCICTHSYLYKRWVLSQARFFIDPCKMPESTLSVEGHWESWVNTNQREWWLIDPFPPDSPSMKCRASSGSPSRPSHPSQPLWACCDPHFFIANVYKLGSKSSK